ncbi:MAG: cytochrome c [Polyangiaceae bacterium]
MLHTVVLWVHSYLRWAILLLGVFFAIGTGLGWRGARPFTARSERVQRALLGLVDLQFLLGLTLFLWLSPISHAFFAEPRAGMRDSLLRFFGIEHALGMLLAIGVLHAGRRRSKRAANDALRQRAAFLSTVGFLVLACLSIPWPGSRHGRPLLRTPVAEAEGSLAVAGSAVACAPLFASRCASCHGPSGRGDGVVGQYMQPAPRDFSQPAFQGDRSDAQIAAVIREGGLRHGLSATMPAHADFELSRARRPGSLRAELRACAKMRRLLLVG